MILKDESVLEIVEQYLAMEVPGTDANAAALPSPSPVGLAETVIGASELCRLASNCKL